MKTARRALHDRDIVREYMRKLGRRGGSARAQSLTTERASEIGRSAVQVRWSRYYARQAEKEGATKKIEGK